MKHPSNEDGRREGRPDAPDGARSDGQYGPADGFLSRSDFEAALPLYVGGELGSDENTRVDSWLQEHPEDRGILEAASASRALLQGHAAALRAADGPDLWAGIRGELAEAGLFAADAAVPAADAGLFTDGVVHTARSGSRASAHGSLGARTPRIARWYERRSLAAAAAVLIFGGLGVVLWGGGGGPDLAPDSIPNSAGGIALNGGAGLVVEAGTLPVFTGTEEVPAAALLAGTNRGVRLRRVTGTAVHILDNAIPVRLEQAQLPDLQRGAGAGPGVQLTGGR